MDITFTAFAAKNPIPPNIPLTNIPLFSETVNAKEYVIESTLKDSGDGYGCIAD